MGDKLLDLTHKICALRKEQVAIIKEIVKANGFEVCSDPNGYGECSECKDDTAWIDVGDKDKPVCRVCLSCFMLSGEDDEEILYRHWSNRVTGDYDVRLACDCWTERRENV